jgi:hypothetical protein
MMATLSRFVEAAGRTLGAAPEGAGLDTVVTPAY